MVSPFIFIVLLSGLTEIRGYDGTESRKKALADPVTLREAEIMDEIFAKYRKDVSPRRRAWFYYDFLKVESVNDETGELAASVYLLVEWTDERLAFNGDDEAKVRDVYIPRNKLWTPNLVHFNSVKDDKSVLGENALIEVGTTGSVRWRGEVTLRSHCQMDVTLFPLDQHVCEQVFRTFSARYDNSWTRLTGNNGDRWELVHKYYPFLKAGGSPAWHRVNQTTDLEFTKPEEGPTDFTTQFCSVKIRLRRNVHYYTTRLLAPVILLSVMVLAVFFIPPESGAKIFFGTTILLIFYVFQLVIDDDLPRSPTSTPLITTAMIVFQTCSVLSILFSILVVSLHYTECRHRLPLVVRFVMFHFVAKIAFYRSAVRDMRKMNQEGKEKVKTFALNQVVTAENLDQPVSERMGTQSHEENGKIPPQYFNKAYDDPAEEKTHGDYDNKGLEENDDLSEKADDENDSSMYEDDEKRFQERKEKNVPVGKVDETTSNVDEILDQELEEILRKQEGEKTKREWVMTVAIIDRLLMYVCLVVMGYVYVSFLVQILTDGGKKDSGTSETESG